MDLDQTPWRIVAQFIDEWRILFNRQVDHLEPWQLICYTISALLFVQWLRKVARFEELALLRKWCYGLLYKIHVLGFRARMDQARDATIREMEERVHHFDRLREFYKFLPERGLGVDDILHEATLNRSMSDILFERGHLGGGVYAAAPEGDEHQQRLLRNIFDLYSFTNAAYPEVYPGCRKMEAEVIRMLCALFHGGARSCGALTSSGTESILLACLAYRNRALKKGIRKPEIIFGRNAHVAFLRAAKMLGLRAVQVGLNNQMELDLGAIKRAISRETCAIVASAPSPIYGNMDPVEEIAKLGLRFHVPVHVDAGVGGFILPFMEQCGYTAAEFDFRLSSVTSISVDLDKYAYCPPGASAVLYRDSTLFHHQCYSDPTWCGGIYASPTLVGGSRSGLLIALAWSLLLYHGRLGLMERAQYVLDSAKQLRDGLAEHFGDRLQLLAANPLGPIIALVSSDTRVPIHQLGDELNELGWTTAFLQRPNGLRFTLGLQQAGRVDSNVVEELLDDLNKGWERVLTSREEYAYPAKTAAVFGISRALTDRGLNDYLSEVYLDSYYGTPALRDRSIRTLSIEGRKLSLLTQPTGPFEISSQLETRDEGQLSARRNK